MDRDDENNENEMEEFELKEANFTEETIKNKKKKIKNSIASPATEYFFILTNWSEAIDIGCGGWDTLERSD